MSTFGKIPVNMWTACVEVRKQGAIGDFQQGFFTTRAEPADIRRYIADDIAAAGLELRAILWIGRITGEEK